MNKQCHRLVFNRARGVLMAVQECASSVGAGGASGERVRARGRRSSSLGFFGSPGFAADRGVDSFRAPLRRIAWSVLLAWGVLAGHVLQAQTLPVTALPGAPAGQRPLIDAAANGVPVVHIAPPTPAGLSRNVYRDFNVDTRGLILNNSASNVLTRQGGWIAGNPQLGYAPARVIVNEVAGPGSSVLRGAIEVAGRSADVVVSNPNGLLCDGCSALNTTRLQLTTGVPRYDAQGGLSSFDVAQGIITVGAGGLDATQLEQLDLIARGLVIEGEVWVQNLRVIAGHQRVMFGSLGGGTPDASPALTPLPGTGEVPLFAVDLKALGGMYAKVSCWPGVAMFCTPAAGALPSEADRPFTCSRPPARMRLSLLTISIPSADRWMFPCSAATRPVEFTPRPCSVATR